MRTLQTEKITDLPEFESLIKSLGSTQATLRTCDCKLNEYEEREFPEGCQGANMLRNEQGKLYHCPGALQLIKEKALENFEERLPAIFKAVCDKNHKPHKYQQTIAKEIAAALNGLWIYGDSDSGKTHLLLRLIHNKIRDCKVYPPSWVMIKAIDLINAWASKYSDSPETKNKQIIYSVLNSEIVLIDDIHHLIKGATNSRKLELFALMDYLHDNKKVLYVTSSISIVEFFKVINDSQLQSRINELCSEIHAIKIQQLELGK